MYSHFFFLNSVCETAMFPEQSNNLSPSLPCQIYFDGYLGYAAMIHASPFFLIINYIFLLPIPLRFTVSFVPKLSSFELLLFLSTVTTFAFPSFSFTLLKPKSSDEGRKPVTVVIMNQIPLFDDIILCTVLYYYSENSSSERVIGPRNNSENNVLQYLLA